MEAKGDWASANRVVEIAVMEGAVATYGPQPRDWSYNMPKKMRQGALRSALSERVREGNVFVVEEWSLENPKTKSLPLPSERSGSKVRL